jgi:hypothetical protein
MIIYQLSNSRDVAEIKKSKEFLEDDPDFVYSVYTNANISQTLNECLAQINHENVRDGPRRNDNRLHVKSKALPTKRT